MRQGAFLVLLPVLAAIAAGCGSSDDQTNTAGAAKAASATKPAAAGPLRVKLDEWQVAPSAQTVSAGTVSIAAVNDGKATHEMVVLRTDKPAASLGKGKHVSEAGSVGEISDLKAGA